MHLTLVKRQLYKIEFHGKLLKAPENGACQHLHFNSPKLGVPTPLACSLNITKISKVGQNSLPKHEL
jgi:hypothetical protein